MQVDSQCGYPPLTRVNINLEIVFNKKCWQRLGAADRLWVRLDEFEWDFMQTQVIQQKLCSAGDKKNNMYLISTQTAVFCAYFYQILKKWQYCS